MVDALFGVAMKAYAGIPIQNLWLLMLYASDLRLSHLRQAIAFIETHQAEPSLLLWFVERLEQYLKQPQQQGIQQQQALGYIRGKVDIARTYRRHMLQRGQVHCQFSQLSFNSPQHQYLYAVLDQLCIHHQTLQPRFKRCQQQFQQLGVHPNFKQSAPPILSNDTPLAELMNLAKLVMEGYLPSTTQGKYLWQQPQHHDVHWLRQLFERAVGGFYKKYLPKTWQVLQGTVLKWPKHTEHQALPQMKTDVILKDQDGRCILIDTKFTQIWTQGYYRKQALFKSPHLYQLYSYLRSQEYPESRFHFSQGLLIYPSVGQSIQADLQLHGYQIGFYTLDLTQDQTQIEQQLLSFIGSSKHIDCDHISWPDTALDRLA